MKTLLIIGAGTNQVAALCAAKAKGHRTVAVDNNPRAAAVALADRTFTVDLRDIDTIYAIAQRERVDGVLALCGGASTRTAAAICRSLDLRGLTPHAAARVTHKGNMLDALMRRSVPVSRYRRTFDLEDAVSAAQDLGWPVVLRPVSGGDPHTVFLASDLEQLSSAYRHVANASAGTNEILVEELRDGPEVSVETLSYDHQHHIIAITDHVSDEESCGLPLAHIEPSRLPRVAQTQIRVATLACLDALELMDSAAHVRLKLTRKGPRVVDVGACLADDHITTELVPRSTGIDLVAAAIDVALNATPQCRVTRYGAAVVRYLRIKPGRVTAIAGIDHARSQNGVAALELLVGVGDALPSSNALHSVSGYVIAEGTDPTEASGRAESAAACVRIETSATESAPQTFDGD